MLAGAIMVNGQGEEKGFSLFCCFGWRRGRDGWGGRGYSFATELLVFCFPFSSNGTANLETEQHKAAWSPGISLVPVYRRHRLLEAEVQASRLQSLGCSQLSFRAGGWTGPHVRGTTDAEIQVAVREIAVAVHVQIKSFVLLGVLL